MYRLKPRVSRGFAFQFVGITERRFFMNSPLLVLLRILTGYIAESEKALFMR